MQRWYFFASEESQVVSPSEDTRATTRTGLELDSSPGQIPREVGRVGDVVL
jgi:hypothetical protein